MEILKYTDTQKKTIYQFDREGKFIGVHNGINETAIKFNIALSSLSSCLKFRRKSAGGYFWSLSRFPTYSKKWGFIDIEPHNEIKVHKFDMEWNYICTYNDVTQAGDTEDLDIQMLMSNLYYQNRDIYDYYYSYERFPRKCPDKPFEYKASQSQKVSQLTYHSEKDKRSNPNLRSDNVATYDSIRQAARILKLSPSSIAKVCKGKQKQCGGFIFCYSNK